MCTADSGRDCSIIIWDTITGLVRLFSFDEIRFDCLFRLPNQTYFDVLNGTSAVAFSSDAKYLATLSQQSPQVNFSIKKIFKEINSILQIVSIWDWTCESDRPLCALELKHEYSNQHYLQFNPRQSTQLVSNSSTQVIFYEWSHQTGLVYFDPELTERVNIIVFVVFI